MFLLVNYPGLQVIAFVYSSVLYVIYLHYHRIYEEPFMLIFETINECGLQIVCYHLVLFTNLIGDPSTLTRIGGSMIFTMGLMMGLSLLIILCINIKETIRKLRRSWMRRKNRKNLAERNAREMLKGNETEIEPKLQRTKAKRKLTFNGKKDNGKTAIGPNQHLTELELNDSELVVESVSDLSDCVLR